MAQTKLQLQHLKCQMRQTKLQMKHLKFQLWQNPKKAAKNSTFSVGLASSPTLGVAGSIPHNRGKGTSFNLHYQQI